MKRIDHMTGAATRMPRLDDKLSRADVIAALAALGLRLPPSIAAAANSGDENLDRLGYQVSIADLDAAMANAELNLSARLNLKSALTSMGLLTEGRAFGSSRLFAR